MSEHPVRRALQRDLLPYLVSAKRLRKQWFYRLHVIFGYTTDIVAGLAVVGVSPPILTLLGSLATDEAEGAKPPELSALLDTLPSWLVYPAAIVILLWIVLRVAFKKEEGQKRAVLSRSCARTLRHAEANLPNILVRSDPLPAIADLLEKTVRPSIDRGIQEDAWPWTPFAPKIDSDVDSLLESLCARFEREWTPPASTSVQQQAA